MYPQQIIDALRHVRYPGTGKDLIESGMLEDDIRISGLEVSFSLIFEKDNDPFMKSVVKASEAAVQTYVDANAAVHIHTKFNKQNLQPSQAAPVLNAKHIIAVHSGKGGVGKSTVAANLAIALSQRGLRVGLLDADIHGPSMPKMFHTEDARPWSEPIDGRNLIIPVEQYGVKMLSIGYFVSPEQATLWRGAMACNALKQLIGEAHWGELDYLVLDTPPGTSDIHLTLVQTLPITGAVIVSTPQQVALADARKGINMYQHEKVNVPILGLVENMAWFTPAAHPAERYFIFGQGGVEQLAREMNVELLAQIPLVQDICESGDTGLPAALNPTSIEGAAFARFADAVVAATEKRNAAQPATRVVETKH